ncbi:hypothetical protein D9756_006814 [Leucocoprinus leucothites]|uniref:Uncharacterized protein n=1 Tax=Leucocoprinus leucothites TaxID=201217 RepID=A0A8H5G2J0_9AGAR|nr:hypothetical protein D9756_006814 [Leucoagaricus leucothites]
MLIYSTQGDNHTPFGSLLLTVFTSIFEVFLLCLAGYILAGRGVLDKKTQKQLNRLNVSLFTPALLFSKVAFFLTPQKLRELWVIPIFFLIVTTASGLVAFVLGWLFKLKRSQRSFAMAAAMFMNSNSLPIALMQSLAVTVPDLRWDYDDNKDAMLGRALTYLVMYSTLGMVLRWSYGVRLLSQADPETKEAETNERTPLLEEFNRNRESPLSASFTSDSSFEDVEGPRSPRTMSQLGAPQSRPPPFRKRTTFYNSFPNSPNRSRANLDQYDTILSNESTELPSYNKPLGSSLASVIRRRVVRCWTALNDFMTAPLWAAIASLLVATIPSFQYWLQHHAKPITGAISSAGKCSIPVTLIVLGAYFYRDPPETVNGTSNTPNMLTTKPSTLSSPPSLFCTVRDLFAKKAQSEHPTSHEHHPKKGETRTVVIAVLSRMIITPMLLMPLIVFSAKYDFHAVFEDPVFVVANVLLLASPPALTLAQITQAVSGDAFERLISRTIFWSYCVVTPPTTIVFVLIGLMLTKL